MATNQVVISFFLQSPAGGSVDWHIHIAARSAVSSPWPCAPASAARPDPDSPVRAKPFSAPSARGNRRISNKEFRMMKAYTSTFLVQYSLFDIPHWFFGNESTRSSSQLAVSCHLIKRIGSLFSVGFIVCRRRSILLRSGRTQAFLSVAKLNLNHKPPPNGAGSSVYE